MLKDGNFYEEVPHDCSKITMKKIRNVIQLAHEISQNEIDYLVNFEFKPRSFFSLPKIHKSNLIKSVCSEKSEKCVEISNPKDFKFRPIVAGPNCS